jgi:hypothetical protein
MAILRFLSVQHLYIKFCGIKDSEETSSDANDIWICNNEYCMNILAFVTLKWDECLSKVICILDIF